MKDTSVLDDAYERIAAAGFELPNGFVNHGAMACEALIALGFSEPVDRWARRYARIGPAVTARAPTDFSWLDDLGVYERLPEWIGFFHQAIDEDGWREVVGKWVPRLLPAISTALFHGAIRTAHAVRAIEAADTAARREELARALGYWAARFHPGTQPPKTPEFDNVKAAITDTAAKAARFYLSAPGIVHLHGVTGTMALHLLADHITAGSAVRGLVQLQSELAALFYRTPPVEDPSVVGVADIELAKAAEASSDPHQVKLVEACRRGTRLTGDPAFAAAAETVTGLSAG